MAKQEQIEPVTETAVKPDIFALPNQTTILFGLIVTVLLGALILGSIGRSPIPVWPLTVALLIFSWRAFLQYPEKEIVGEEVLTRNDNFDLLRQTIARLAEKIGLSRLPILTITAKDEIRTVGTFRRWYFLVGYQEAEILQTQLQDAEHSSHAEAKLIHELYHFQTSDHWQMNYTRQLLRYTFLVLGWAILFFFGFGLLLLVAAPDILQLDPSELFAEESLLPPEMQQTLIQIFPTASEIEEVRLQAAEINLGLVLNFVLNAFLPFILIGGILSLFYWPKLWRMREVYADAGVVKMQKETTSLLARLSSPALKLQPGMLQQMLPATPACSLKQAIREWWRQGLRRLTKTHYDTATRIDHIANPASVFGCWFDTAVLIGPLVLLLDILLASTLTLLYVGNWPMHFSTLIVFVIVSLSLIPELVLGRSGWPYMFKTISVIVGFRLIWVALTLSVLFILFLLAPAILNEIMAAAVAGVAGYAGYSDGIYFDDLGLFVLEASVLNLAQVFIIFLILLLFLTLIILLVRRLLTWYGLPQAEKRLMKVAYAVIGIGTFSLTFTILPLTTAALLEPANLLNPTVVTMAVLGVVITAVAFLLFLRADRRYAGLCPQCRQPVTGSFALGKRCDATGCGEFLHPWLIAEYEL
jgi:hypothetical protein